MGECRISARQHSREAIHHVAGARQCQCCGGRGCLRYVRACQPAKRAGTCQRCLADERAALTSSRQGQTNLAMPCIGVRWTGGHCGISAATTQQIHCAASAANGAIMYVNLLYSYAHLYAQHAYSVVNRRQQPPGVQLAHCGREQAVGRAHSGFGGELQSLNLLRGPGGQVLRHGVLRACNVLHHKIPCRTQRTRRMLWQLSCEVPHETVLCTFMCSAAAPWHCTSCTAACHEATYHVWH
jgi:hypothetical protein